MQQLLQTTLSAYSMTIAVAGVSPAPGDGTPASQHSAASVVEWNSLLLELADRRFQKDALLKRKPDNIILAQ